VRLLGRRLVSGAAYAKGKVQPKVAKRRDGRPRRKRSRPPTPHAGLGSMVLPWPCVRATPLHKIPASNDDACQLLFVAVDWS